MYSYSFNPLPSIPPSHEGFWGLAFLCVLILLLVLSSEPDSLVNTIIILAVPLVITYVICWHLTSQEPQVFANQPVTAEFVEFQTEGYREQVGKSRVDRHKVYVVYKVDGNQVILPAETGAEYLPTRTLYRN